MTNIIIKDGHVVDAKNGLDNKLDILISGSHIEKIAPEINVEGAKVLDARGLTIIPGLCDMHCHLREPGFEYKEDIYTGTKAAARGGFTTVACMPNTDPVNDNASITHSIKTICEEKACVNVLPIGAITHGLHSNMLTEMGMMQDAGCVAFSDDGKPVVTAKVMYLALQYAKNFDALLISHCEEDTLKGDMNEGAISTKLGLKGIPNSAESIIVAREILLAEDLDAKIHIAHISTLQSVDIIRNAKARGVKVSCETCPHYIAGTDDIVLGYDTSTKVNPPIRSEVDRQAIIEGIKDGTIDAIATDHAPHHLDDKRVEYSLAANGISGFESAFALCYTYLVKSGLIGLDRLVEMMSYRPLEILKQKDNGISESNIANLTIVNLDKEYAIDPEKFVSKGKNNPFGGYKVYGEVAGTIVNGDIRFWDK
jgi:dihydroorotase